MITATGAQSTSNEILARIRRAAQEGLQTARVAVTAAAVSRAPTVDDEYNFLMEGDGGVSSVPRDSGGSADPDGRRRLIKDEATYIANIIPLPLNSNVLWNGETGTLRLGNIGLLEASTMWSYQNWSKKHGPYPLITKGPYFANLENGSSATIVPQFLSQRKSGSYPLTPDADRRLQYMYKSVRPHRMFGYEVLQPIFIETMEVALSSAGPRSAR